LANLLLDPHFAGVMASYHQDWRKVVSLAAENGIAIPAFMSALAYYDGYRSGFFPRICCRHNVDYFGAHTYQRVDKEGKFHTQWTA